MPYPVAAARGGKQSTRRLLEDVELLLPYMSVREALIAVFPGDDPAGSGLMRVVSPYSLPEGNGTPANADADMQLADTSEFTSGNLATLSKETGTAHVGTRVLRVIRTSSNFAAARMDNELTAGVNYRAIGLARSLEGTALPRLVNSSTIWTGTTSTDWQPFDFPFTSGNQLLAMQVSSLTENTGVEFNFVRIIPDTVQLPGERLYDADLAVADARWYRPFNSAVVTKVDDGGSNVLQVARNGSNNAYAGQEILCVGKRYHVTGEARSDGTGIPRVGDASTTVWTGDTGTGWDEFDLVWTATHTRLLLQNSATSNSYVQFRNLSVEEIPMYSGAVSGAAANETAPAALAKAFSFDGNDAVVVQATRIDAPFDELSGTLGGPVRMSDPSDWTDGTVRVVARYYVDANNYIRMGKSASDNTFFFEYVAGGTTKSISVGSLSLGTDWFFPVMTWDDTADEFKAFINGVQVGSTQTGLGTWAGTLTQVTIGALNAAGDNGHKGLLTHHFLENEAADPVDILEMATIAGLAA